MERKLGILVVDDEQIVLDSINKHLRKDNFSVHTALTAHEGLDLLGRIDIDIVLTDLMMPGIDGLELMKMIKAKHSHMPVIMITGYATINTALKATQLGAFDYIAKPFSKTELKGVIMRAVELVSKTDSTIEPQKVGAAEKPEGSQSGRDSFKTIGDQSWIVLQESGRVLLGVERSFLHGVGRIQTIFLPSKGDQIRQGSVYFEIFSSDLRAHTVISPLSGTVVELNERVLSNPESLIEDPYGEGWLIKIEPSNFDYERKLLGL
ncbi:MAG: response regulator [candidate division Zixibacteria bacterium]|nr:response regulator [candidate division Zixibacteria bacterium]